MDHTQLPYELLYYFMITVVTYNFDNFRSGVYIENKLGIDGNDDEDDIV